MKLHTESQDTTLPAWHQLLDLIEQAARDGRETFIPRKDLGMEAWSQIVTLPPTIAKLKSVKHLDLYRSHLVRIPPEIGEMEALEEFVPYTSYSLHWFPFEITRCENLKDSTVSTRAIYGNRKNRMLFPQLPHRSKQLYPDRCSVCRGPFTGEPFQYWITLDVGTDAMPLLVHACSKSCVEDLPRPALEYVAGYHQGGPEVIQPTERLFKIVAVDDDEFKKRS